MASINIFDAGFRENFDIEPREVKIYQAINRTHFSGSTRRKDSETSDEVVIGRKAIEQQFFQ